MNPFIELKNYLSGWLKRLWSYLLGKTTVDDRIQEKVDNLRRTIVVVKEEIEDVKDAVEDAVEDAKDFAESAERVVDEALDVLDAVQGKEQE